MTTFAPRRLSASEPPLPKTEWGWAIAVVSALSCLRLVVLAIMAGAQHSSPAAALASWDAQHYISIAREGYGGEDDRSYAFFPAFPLLLRLSGRLLGPLMQHDSSWYLLAGLLNTVISVVFVAGIMALCARWGDFGAPSRALAAAVVYGAPMSVVYTMAYTEALFGALTVWALVYLHDRRWLALGLALVAAGTVRLTAVDLIAAVAVVVVLKYRRVPAAWLAVLIAPLGLASYLLWANAHITTASGYFALQQEHWNSGFDGGLATLNWVFTSLVSHDNFGYLLSTAVIIGAPVIVAASFPWFVLRNRDWGTWLFSAALTANIVLSDGIMHSRPRLLMLVTLLLAPLVVHAWRAAGPKSYGRWCTALAVAAWVCYGAWSSAHMLVVFPWAI